jgi:DNA ligase-1
MTKLQTLYKRDSKGNVQEWTICIDGNAYYVIEGLQKGKKTQTEPHTCEPKNPGKKNATTAVEQAAKEAQAKWEHKLAHGYSLTVEGIDSTGYQEPMLAKQYEDYEDEIEEDLWIDDKLNGMRCNARESSVKSRKNKPINTIPHIVRELAPKFEEFPKLFIDGELYNPKLKENLNQLIELTSVAYQPKDITPELLAKSEAIVQFHVYDGFNFSVDEDVGFCDHLLLAGELVTQATPFPIRREALRILLAKLKYVKVLGYKTIKNGKKNDRKARAEAKKKLKEMLAQVVKDKGEGLIIRYAPCPYEFKRSKYLLKAKNFMDAEFEIEDVQEGNGDWAGCAKRIVLKLPKPVIGRDGNKQTNFASNIEGNRDYLRKMFSEREKVIGDLATCEFQGWSEYGVPLIPYIRAIRNYE